MKVYIYAFEDEFQGLHGISDQSVAEFDIDDLSVIGKESNIIGQEMASDVIQSYEYMLDWMPDREDYETDDEYDDAYDAAFEEETQWITMPIRKDFQSMSVDDLIDLASELGPEEFQETYCREWTDEEIEEMYRS